MRIISGKYKGRKIELPRNLEIRPTTDFANEKVYLIFYLIVSILKRLRYWIYFLEQDLLVMNLHREEYKILYLLTSMKASRFYKIRIAEISNAHSARYTQMFSRYYPDLIKSLISFSVIRLMITENIKNLPFLVFDSFILKDDGLLIIEHSKNYCFENEDFYLHTRRYGKVHFSFFSKNAEKYFFK